MKNNEFTVMNKKKVFLIYPTLVGEIVNSLAQLASVFEDEGFTVRALINSFKKPLSNHDFIRSVKEFDPDVVAISTLTYEMLNTYKLIKLLNEEGYTVLVGGPHATNCPEEVVENGADIVVRNEGEETVRELCRYWSGKAIHTDINKLGEKWNQRYDKGIRAPEILSSTHTEGLGAILGITYMDNTSGKIISNPPRKRIVDIGSIPVPNYDVFDHDVFRDNDNLIRGTHRIYTTRGCPATCTFCDWRVFGQRVTFESIPKIIKEMKRRVRDYGTTNFTIADDVFTVNKTHVEKFCAEVSKIRPKVEWQASTRAEFVNAEMLEMMKKSGCYLVSYGLESGDEETLLRMDKRVKLEDNLKAPKLASRAGLKVYANLMVGFPWETPKSIDNTLKMVHVLWEDVFLFQVSGSLVPFPGTRTYDEYASEYGFKDYWLKEGYQQFGIQTYQNNENPFLVSTYYQRNLFDDSYIQEERFFNYSKEYKAKVAEFVFEIGRHNLENIYPNQLIKQKILLTVSKISYYVYKVFPNLEKIIIGNIYEMVRIGGRRPASESKRDRRRGIGKKSGLKG